MDSIQQSDTYSEHYTVKSVSKKSTELALDEEVDRIVKDHVFGEEVYLEDKSEVPRGVQYLYRSTERPLSFTVLSSLQGTGGIPGGGSYRQIQCVDVAYAEGLKKYYRDQVDALLAGADFEVEDRRDFSSKTIFYENFEEFEKIAKELVGIDDIYKQELIRYPQEWLKEFPLYRFHMHFRNADTGLATSICCVDITGDWDEESIYQYLLSEHANANANGRITDERLSSELSIDSHKDVLYNIYVDDTNISDVVFYKNKTYNGVKRMHYASEDLFYSAVYYKPWNTYLILLDVGPIYAGNTWETMMDTYLKILSDQHSYFRDEKGSKITWTRGMDEWEITTELSKDNRDYDFSISISKNGAVQDIPFVKKQDEESGFHGMALVCAGIPVEEFADLFDLSVKIDESREDGCVIFRTHEIEGGM